MLRFAAWSAGLGVTWLGAIGLLAPHASAARRRAPAIEAVGAPPLPGGSALELLSWPGIALAALAYVATIGALAAVLAHAVSDLPGSTRARAAVAAATALLLVVVGLVRGEPGPFAVCALAFALACALHLAANRAGPPARPGVGWTWPAAALVLLPLAFVADRELPRDLRAGLLAAPGGEVVVNGYYRHALLAAEPLKGPSQRLYLTWATADDATAPPALVCRNEPAPWLEIAATEAADVELRRDADGRLLLVSAGARVAFAPDALDEALTTWQAATTPRGLRMLVVAGVLVGLPLLVAWGALRAGIALTRARRPGSILAGGAILGVAAAVLVALSSADVGPAVDGGGSARMAAAADPDTTDDALAELAGDRLIPVRARALAQRIRRVSAPETTVAEIRAAETWHEQWYGLRALQARGWHPDPDC